MKTLTDFRKTVETGVDPRLHAFILRFVSCREADSLESKVSNGGDKNLAGSYRRLSFICSFSGS